MPARFRTKDRVLETSITTGAGTYTLAGAATGFQTFVGGDVAAGDFVPYFAEDGINWELGIGEVLSGPARLVRTTVLKSSNANAAVDWGAGTRNLRCGWPAELNTPRVKSVSIAGGAGAQVLTQDQQRCDVLILTGAITGNRDVEVDTAPWRWIVFNNTSGAFSVTVKVNGGVGVAVNQGRSRVLYCDGTDVEDGHTDSSSDVSATALGNGVTMLNGVLVHSRAGNAETIALKTLASGGLSDPSPGDPVTVIFRNVTAANGLPEELSVTAASSLTISSGSTLGASNGVPFRLWVVGFNDGGTFRLGVINCLGSATIYPLAAWGVASATAEGGAGAADSALVFYAGAAVASKAYSVLGYSSWEAGLAAAGTWGTAPTRQQLFGPGVPLPNTPVQRTWSNNIAGSTTGNGAMTDVTGASITITPSSACNPVEFAATWNSIHNNSAATNNTSYLQAVRGATTISATDAYELWYSSGGGGSSVAAPGHTRIMDKPFSSAAVTYKLQHRIGGANSPSRTTSNINLNLTEVMA